jgi:hypothetical protein
LSAMRSPLWKRVSEIIGPPFATRMSATEPT